MQPTVAPAPGQVLQETLLGYLANHAFAWPGADGLTIQDALDSYLQAVARGRVPGREELCRRHPELCDQLASWFASVAIT
jgi:hypothetical protein